MTNGGFFQTAARLARYTGDQKYADWANKVWDWSTGVGFVTADFHVVDGAGDGGSDNCTKQDKNEWTYNSATYMMGAANMYAFTKGDKVWEKRVQGLVNTAKTQFFTEDGIMHEACEASNKCNTDNTSFKSSLARWMGRTAVLVPSVRSTITDLLEKSAAAAAAACTGSTCGNLWTSSTPLTGKQDFGTQLSALEIVQSLLVLDAPLKLATAQGAQTPTPAQPQLKFTKSVHKTS